MTLYLMISYLAKSGGNTIYESNPREGCNQAGLKIVITRKAYFF